MTRNECLPPGLAARFKALQDVPEGLIEHRIGQFSQIAVARDGTDIFMAFCPLDRPLANENLTAVMARYDPADPLLLRGRYMQAMLAAHAFAPRPRRIYLMGAGGGRLALVQRYLLEVPEIIGSDLDPAVLALSQCHFGLEPAPGLRIEAGEGSAHLAAQGDARFDHIYVDCFSARGRVPTRLANQTAIKGLCAALGPGGVMAMNLPPDDPLASCIRDEIARAFPEVWQWQEAGSQVLFGMMGTAAPNHALPQIGDLGFDLAADMQRLTRIDRPPPG